MAKDELYNKYVSLFPDMANRTTLWFPHGKNSIKVRIGERNELIFSYYHPDEWMLETKASYVRREVEAKKTKLITGYKNRQIETLKRKDNKS